MARCEDYPCCGHYDEATGPGGGSWCPDESGRFPDLGFVRCRACGYLHIAGDDHYYECEGGWDEEEEEDNEEEEFIEQASRRDFPWVDVGL